MSIIFNQICINEEMLLKYICVCVCVSVRERDSYLKKLVSFIEVPAEIDV